MGRASGWLRRAQRLLDREGSDRVERGYLLLPGVSSRRRAATSRRRPQPRARRWRSGERFGDADLFALAAHEQGEILIRLGRLEEGLALLDEAMVAVTAGELSPIVTGIVYCGVILACQAAHEVRRAREWTAALRAGASASPTSVAFTGRCLVHRAEIMQLEGAAGRRPWRRRNGPPSAACAAGTRRRPARRATGRARSTACAAIIGAAEQAYREASRLGREPQPGLALLRLAQGERRGGGGRDPQGGGRDASEPAGAPACCPPTSRSCSPSTTSRRRARPAEELESIADGRRDGALGALAAQARGAVELAAGDARSRARLAAPRRRGSGRSSRRPTRRRACASSPGSRCRALGDEDTARRWSWRRPAAPTPSSGRRRTSLGSAHSRALAGATPMG